MTTTARFATCAISLLSCSLEARQLVAPSNLLRGPLIKPYADIFTHTEWHLNSWFGRDQHSTFKAFNAHGTSTPFSTLLFGKAAFNPQEAFSNSVAQSTCNPLLETSILRPRVRYDESNNRIGADWQKYIDECTRVGLRASLSVKKITIKRIASSGNGMSDLGGETIDDYLAERIETVNGIPVKSFAYRLDLLSKLPFSCKPCPDNRLPIVVYSDTDFPPHNPITISGQDITDQAGSPVTALKSSSGSLPTQPWAITQDKTQQIAALNSSGRNLKDFEHGRFDSSVSYSPLGNSPAEQATLFIVPSLEGTDTTQESRVIQSQVEEVLACIASEAEDIFKDCGISFSSQTVTGVGDLKTEFYLGHFISPHFYVEGFAGVRWPSAKRTDQPQNIFKLPLGNNGHYEIEGGAQVLYKPCRWGSLQGTILGCSVLSAREYIASPFRGARVKNLGTSVPATIKWNYYQLHTDILFTPPNCHGFGALIGYAYFDKAADQITLCAKTALDCLGARQPLNAQVATRNTRIINHKVRTEFFIDVWGSLQLYGGASTVVSGKNTARGTFWHIGINAYF